MSRKQNRKHHHNNPQKNITPRSEPRLPSDAHAVHTDKSNGNEVHDKDQKDEEPAKLTGRWNWDLMTALTAVLAGGAIITFALLWIQLEDSRENFVKDQRPYVWYSSIKPLPSNVGQKIFVNIYFADFGKSPALQFIGKGKVFFGPNAMAEGYKWFDSLDQGTLKQETGSIIVIPPGIPTDPEKGNFVTVLSDTIVNTGDMNFISTNDFSVVVVSRVQYQDLSGHIYQSDVCVSRLQTAAISHCEKHNQML